MKEQKIPGVVDAQLAPLSEKAYAAFLALALATATLAILIIAWLPS